MRAWLAIAVCLTACHPAPPATVPVAELGAPVAAPSPPPPPGDPAPRTEGAITDAWVHGIHVLVKRISGAESTATALAIRGGVRNWTAADAGVERLALRTAVDGGTEHAPRDAFVQRLAELGSTLTADSGEDFARVDAWCLTPAWDETFRMLADAVRHPALPPAQLELERAAQLAALRAEQDDPDAKLHRTLAEVVFRDHPYARRALGTPATVGALTLAQVRAHLARLREGSRLVLVVVGDVDPAHVLALTAEALGDLPRGAYAEGPLPALQPIRGQLTVIAQPLPTNYITAVAPAPRWGEPDFTAMRVAMTALRTRVFAEVRTKRNLSYAPSAFMRLDGVPLLGLYVTAVDPVATLGVMLGEARRLRDEPMGEAELAGAKAQLLTFAAMDQEAPAGQASTLLAAEVVGGDWRLLQDLPARVHAVTAAQIQAWARAHLAHLQTVVLGDPSKLDRAALESF